MKKLNKKKGFTLVELIVVIAILAILATVSIVGYVSFVKKAKVSNDQSLVAQINTMLQAEEAIPGNEKTLHAALTLVSENGFDIEKLTPTSDGNDILWNQETNRFELVSKDEVKTDAYKWWKIYGEVPSTQTYSIYLKSGATVPAGELTVTTGLDVGENTNLSQIKYTGDKHVTIRTNSESAVVTVDNADAEVDWYGVGGTVSVLHAAPKSVHIFGKLTGKVVVSDGHVVMEKGSSAAAIEITGATASVDNTASPETMVIVESTLKADVEKNGGLNVAAGSVLAYGENDEAAVGTQSGSFDEVLSIWQTNGGTLRLLKDVTYEATIYTQVIGTLDLNGHTLSYTANTAKSFAIAGEGATARLTVKNGTIISTERGVGLLTGCSGIVENTTIECKKYCVYIADGSHLTMVDSKVVAKELYGDAIALKNNNNDVNLKNVSITADDAGVISNGSNNRIIIDYCTINSGYAGVYQNGSDNPCYIEIKNSTIVDIEGNGVYVSNSAGKALQTLVMENCTVTGPTAVEVKHTNATIKGCTLIANYESLDVRECGNGQCTAGYAFAATSNSASDKVTGRITLTDCTFDTKNAAKTFVFQLADGASVTINGKAAEVSNSYTVSGN